MKKSSFLLLAFYFIGLGVVVWNGYVTLSTRVLCEVKGEGKSTETKKETLPCLVEAQNNSIFYAIFAGVGTASVRLPALDASWLRWVPKGYYQIFTNGPANSSMVETLSCRTELREYRLPPGATQRQLDIYNRFVNQLTRIRETADLVRRDQSIRWICLTEDDSYLFIENTKQFLEAEEKDFDPVEQEGIAGFVELSAIALGEFDNTIFAKWKREAERSDCLLPGEERINHSQEMCHTIVCWSCTCMQGGTIFLSRKLFLELVPLSEECESLTEWYPIEHTEQRLNSCIRLWERRKNKQVKEIQNDDINRIYDPWDYEKDQAQDRPIAFHTIGRSLSYTHSMVGEMVMMDDIAHPGGKPHLVTYGEIRAYLEGVYSKQVENQVS